MVVIGLINRYIDQSIDLLPLDLFYVNNYLWIIYIEEKDDHRQIRNNCNFAFNVSCSKC